LNIKSIIVFIISLVSVLGINFIPLEMLLYRDFSGESAMLLYALETVVAIFLTAIFVFLFAPEREQAKKIMTRRELLQVYLLATGGLSAVSGVFLCVFIFLILKAELALASIVSGLLWIFGFQILEFIADFIMLRPLSLAKADVFLQRSLNKAVLLFLGVFIGVFLALFVDKWFVAPFIVLKTTADIADQIEIFTGFGKKDENDLSTQTVGKKRILPK
jgi:Family of unknown function (DUF6498)